MSVLFVTASGTDIGKTFVTAALIDQLGRAGRRAAALKPVMSGYDPDRPEDCDAATLLRALASPVTPETIDNIAPFRFRAALAPPMAAAREGREIDFDEIVALCRARDAANPLLIEGVGGALSPLTDAHTCLDLLAALDAPALLVGGSYLGAISHLLATEIALRQRGVPIAGIIISESPQDRHDSGDDGGDDGGGVTLAETVECLRRFLPAATIVAIPRRNSAPDNWRTAPDLIGPLGL